jgi:hypothetical protein
MGWPSTCTHSLTYKWDGSAYFVECTMCRINVEIDYVSIQEELYSEPRDIN